ncbi:hypothetical protein KUCAC02_023990, partial [Chaenocephalus aceratus]
QTQLSSGLAVNQGELSAGANPFYFGPPASASLRLNDPSDSKCQNRPTTTPPSTHPDISQKSSNP